MKYLLFLIKKIVLLSCYFINYVAVLPVVIIVLVLIFKVMNIFNTILKTMAPVRLQIVGNWKNQTAWLKRKLLAAVTTNLDSRLSCCRLSKNIAAQILLIYCRLRIVVKNVSHLYYYKLKYGSIYYT